MKKVSVKELQAKVEGFMNEHAKKIILGLLIATVCGVGGCSLEDAGRVKNGKEAKELAKQVETLNKDNKELEDKNNSLEKEVESLEKKVEIAKDYLDLDDNEKEAVDAKIVEVNEATEQKKAEEQARKEQEEKERKAKEEEEKKAKEEEERAKREAEEQARKEQEEKEKQEKTASLERTNAIATAKSYLNCMPFSRTGLIKQLEYEGYSTEAATYAVDNIDVDWNEQCAKTAESYLSVMAFSRDGLYSQLQYEGFTEEQIQYGLSSVGY